MDNKRTSIVDSTNSRRVKGTKTFFTPSRENVVYEKNNIGIYHVDNKYSSRQEERMKHVIVGVTELFF